MMEVQMDKQSEIKTEYEKLPGHETHKISMGIHDCLTFGFGELDQFGYWQHPCAQCARHHEKAYPNDGPCWPHSEEQIEVMNPTSTKRAKNVSCSL